MARASSIAKSLRAAWVSLAILSAVACGDGAERMDAPAQSLDPDAGIAVLQEDSGGDAGLEGAVAPDAGLAPDAASLADAGDLRDLRDRLLSLDGLDVEELFAPVPGTRAFSLKLRQPEDHGAPSEAQFKQRLILVHRDERAPMVLSTTGYGLFGDPEQFTSLLTEPTVVLDANQLTVEHRFFGKSIAREPVWEHLTIEQSARDSHRIVQILSEIYRGPWVGTGVSKGGMTAIFHQRFFPDDLAAIVPYVAPISFGLEDPRYLHWVAEIGPGDGRCRERVKDMEVELVERRDEIAAHLATSDPQLAFLRPELLSAVVTFPAFGWHWGFWQYWGSAEACAALPIRGAPADELSAWFSVESTVQSLMWGAPDFETMAYVYQAARELGAQAIDYTHLGPATANIDYSILPASAFEAPPWGADPVFDPRPILEVDAFLRERAQHVLAIYGAWDPWSGGRAHVNEVRDNLVVLVPEIGHSAQLSILPSDEQDAILDRLHAWVGRSPGRPVAWSAKRARLGAPRSGQERLMALTRALEAQIFRQSLRSGPASRLRRANVSSAWGGAPSSRP